ncbi:MAG: hypothetical protein ACW99U_06345 [Candidatus Thorarchaeota archaeon]|jgi:hypothetical protein
MKGKTQRNPNLEVLAEWAYFKAPSTKDHRFTPITTTGLREFRGTRRMPADNEVTSVRITAL